MITRIGTYETGLKYYNNNKEILNVDKIEFIKSLKIPPAYDNVSILNNKKIIAYGYDKKGRKQVIYNPEYTNERSLVKYNKILKSIKIFKKIKNKIKRDITHSNQKTKEIAMIIYLILNCGFRIGNEKYEKDYNSFGLTTLKYHHIDFKNNNIHIDFIGKKGVRNYSICKNKYIYTYLLEKKNIRDENDNIFSYSIGKLSKEIKSKDVNEYLKLIDKSHNITSKDLRTWNANYLFVKFFKDKNIQKQKNPVKKAIEEVANKLHNSYEICKKSYISPDIIKYAEELLTKTKEE